MWKCPELALPELTLLVTTRYYTIATRNAGVVACKRSFFPRFLYTAAKVNDLTMILIIGRLLSMFWSIIYDVAIVETGARNADVSRGAYKFPIQEGRLLSMF